MGKKVVLVVTPHEDEGRRVAKALEEKFEEVTAFFAADGTDALSKMRNAKPDVLITELELPKLSGYELLRLTVEEKEFQSVGVIVLSDIPDQESIANDVVRGKVKVVAKPLQLPKVFEAVSGFFARPLSSSDASFQLRFYQPGDMVFREGDKAECAFLVRKGKLRAYRTTGGKRHTLGTVFAGEFLGEMAYIHGEPRSASAEALEDSELVEIPLGTLDLLIFSKPAWTKALLKTLCRRLHDANQKKGLRGT